MIPEEIKNNYPTNAGLRAIHLKNSLILWVIVGTKLIAVDLWVNFMGSWEREGSSNASKKQR